MPILLLFISLFTQSKAYCSSSDFEEIADLFLAADKLLGNRQAAHQSSSKKRKKQEKQEKKRPKKLRIVMQRSLDNIRIINIQKRRISRSKNVPLLNIYTVDLNGIRKIVFSDCIKKWGRYNFIKKIETDLEFTPLRFNTEVPSIKDHISSGSWIEFLLPIEDSWRWYKGVIINSFPEINRFTVDFVKPHIRNIKWELDMTLNCNSSLKFSLSQNDCIEKSFQKYRTQGKTQIQSLLACASWRIITPK